MKTFKKISSAIFVSCVAFVGVTGALAAPPDISGSYNCSGNDPLSTPPPFSEKLVFTKNGSTYNVQAIPTGDALPYFLGTALFTPGVDDAFGEVYWNVKDSTSFGTELFTIKPDGSLDAVFVGYNRDKLGTETCKKM